MVRVSRVLFLSLSLLTVAAACGDDGGPSTPIDAPTVDAPIDGVVVVIDAAIDGPDVPIDAPIDGPSGVCNPLSPPGQQGCGAAEKCTWVSVQEDPDLGVLRCVPDGAVAIGGACTTGPAGEATGYDNCAAGLICISGACQDICGFGGSAGEVCAPGYACTRYSGLFANGDDDAIAGACNPSCDPVTQTVAGGGMCPSGQGCYTLTSATTTVAVCAGAGTPTHGMPIVGQVFANSCAPGHSPRRPAPGATTWECGALCRPAAVTTTTNMASEGGVEPYSCESRGAAPPGSALSGESCRYFWAREPFDDLSPFSNTAGFCFKHAVYQYDTNGDMIPDAPFPRCINVTTGDVLPPIGNPPHNDALFFWCAPQPTSLTSRLLSGGRSKLPNLPVVDRLDGWH